MALLTPAQMIQEADPIGQTYELLIGKSSILGGSQYTGGVDLAGAGLVTLTAAQLGTIFPADTTQGIAYYQATGAATAPATSGGVSAFGGGAIGAFGGVGGAGALLRNTATAAAFSSLMQSVNKNIRQFAVLNAIAGVVDLGTYANYQNGLTAFSMLYTPQFAAAYALAMNLLPPVGSVFAPKGIPMATVTITGSGTCTVSANAATNWPMANGYAVPAPTTDAYGNNVYVGGLPVAQAFALAKNLQMHVTTTIGGTCVITVTGVNQAGLTGRTWTATLSSVTAGTLVALTPTNAGDRIAGVPTGVAVAGTATTGVAILETGNTER